MVRSMTGFGRGEFSDEARKITVEMKAVNHRYLDTSIKLPKKLGMFEADIRNVLKEYAKRGKVDIYITYEELSEGSANVKYNPEIAAEYLNHMRTMAKDLGLDDDIRVSTIARLPEVMSLEDAQVDEEVIREDLIKAFRLAAAQFVEAREREGESLKSDLISKLQTMRTNVAAIEERSPQIVEEYKKRLYDKVSELLADSQVEESRLVMEVTLFADKVAVDEEIVRLKTHIDSMEKELVKGGEVGRKLDFIAQEMNREANTTLSKANDLVLSDVAIEIKTLIEKIREQIQNLE